MSVRPIPSLRDISLPSKRMFVVFGGTPKVGTGWGNPGGTVAAGFPLEGNEGTMSGLLVGVNDGTGVLEGEAVKVGGTSGTNSIAASEVSCIVTFGVFVAGNVLVGSFVLGNSVAVSDGWKATAVTIGVGNGSGVGGSEFEKLLTATIAIRIKAETRIKTAIIRDDVFLSRFLTIANKIA